jgi:hypothetical protein
MKDPELRANLGNLGKRRASDFSWEKHVSEILAIAQRVIDKKPLITNRMRHRTESLG